MKLVLPPRTYPSIDAFYDELPDVDRKLSGELDFGVHWTEPWEERWPPKRVSVVENTGELYTFNARTGSVRVLAVFDGYDEAEWALSGWSDHCGPGGLRWLRDRLEECAPKFVCSKALYWGRQADHTFDPDRPCRCHNSTKHWKPDPTHRRRSRVGCAR